MNIRSKEYILTVYTRIKWVIYDLIPAFLTSVLGLDLPVFKLFSVRALLRLGGIWGFY